MYWYRIHEWCADSLSSDGTILAIVAPMHDERTGDSEVRVYQRTQSIDGEGTATYSWAPLGGPMQGETPASDFAWSVSLSSDGSIIAVCALWPGTRYGSAQV